MSFEKLIEAIEECTTPISESCITIELNRQLRLVVDVDQYVEEKLKGVKDGA